MTIIFEQRQVNDQMVMVQFQFPSQFAVNGIQGCSLDKYISFDVWSQIYSKLQSPFEQFVKMDDEDDANKKTQLKSETIKLQRAQLELRLSWRSTKQFHKDVAKQESKSCDLYSSVLVVKVDTFEAIDKYRKHYQEKSTEKSTTKLNSVEKCEAISERTSNGSSSNDNEEYVPEFVTTVKNNLDYTPSTLSNSKEQLVTGPTSDEYTPDSNIKVDLMYEPKPIDNTSPSTAVKQTGLNRNDVPEKIKMKRTESKITNLFGADSGDDAESNEQKRSLRLTKGLKSDVVKNTPKQQSKVDKWLSTKKDRSEKDPFENGTSREKKRKITTNNSVDLSPASAQEREDRKMRQLREELESELQKFEHCEVDRIIDLEDMSDEHINKSFKQHEPVLKQIFRKNINIVDHRFDATKNECDYLLLLSTLLTVNQQKTMYTKIRNSFCRQDQETITTNHENLIWKCLVPEWGLNIFMDTFSLSRDEAISHLRKQDQFLNKKNTPDELEFNFRFD